MIKIGITGHRELNKNYMHLYEEKVFLQLKNLQTRYTQIMIISSLADGADRLIVNQALKLGIGFKAILPMPKEEYEKDFDSKSKLEFYRLLSKAKEIITLRDSNRDVAYEKAGHFVSDNCDILFTLWDGKYIGLKGGTGEIVKYHFSKKSYILYHLSVLRDDDSIKNNMVKWVKHKKESDYDLGRSAKGIGKV